MYSVYALFFSKQICCWFVFFKVYEIMETAPFGKRQKGEIGKNIVKKKLMVFCDNQMLIHVMVVIIISEG